MDRGAGWATDHGTAQPDTTERTHTHAHTHHLFFIHSPVDGHLSCFHVLAQMGNKNERKIISSVQFREEIVCES